MAALICFSHLRWNFVYQRPQHLMTRFAQSFDVIFFEEPLLVAGSPSTLKTQRDPSGVLVVTPILSPTLTEIGRVLAQRFLLDELLKSQNMSQRILWYYTPMALPFSRHIDCVISVYDCMDELSNFKDAPVSLRRYEAELFNHVDLVFTGGHSLYEAKRRYHDRVHAFPSSVEVQHFNRSRDNLADPEDQGHIPRPRLGFFGVVDERVDTSLIASIAAARPDWQLIIVGPVAKIDLATLPRADNIHYLGGKNYQSLPDYIGGWDIALMPFAQNEATRYISPTKTPEYLAAGKPVISTPIHDVVQAYGRAGLVSIASSCDDFIREAELLLQATDRSDWLARVDATLAQQSWDLTRTKMMSHMQTMIAQKMRRSVFITKTGSDRQSTEQQAAYHERRKNLAG